MAVDSEEQLRRVRRICSAIPGTTEKISHGEPTFFAKKGVYVMFSNNHHNDGHVAALVPAAPGVQEMLVHTQPRKYYRPAYVGPAGWVGIELNEVSDDELSEHILEGWRIIDAKSRTKRPARKRAL